MDYGTIIYHEISLSYRFKPYEIILNYQSDSSGEFSITDEDLDMLKKKLIDQIMSGPNTTYIEDLVIKKIWKHYKIWSYIRSECTIFSDGSMY